MTPGALFPGADPKLRFGKALSSLLEKNGVSKTYGTHSVRKGVATYACGGSTGGPSIVSVCLRCGWSIGGVQDRYFRYEAAGDQYLGRAMAGLPVNDSNFAALPSHFRDNSDATVSASVVKMFPGLAQETNLGGILRLCLASLVHHADFLVRTLPDNHALLSTSIFADLALQHELMTKLDSGQCTWMEPTGIPPHVELYKKLDKQQEAIDALPDRLEQRMEKVLEEKGVAAGNITRAILREEIKSLLTEAGLQQTASPVVTNAPPNPLRHYYSWGGKFHKLPRNFEFPSIDPLSAWRLWWFGDLRRGYPPYRGITSDDLALHKTKSTLSEWSMMMRHIMDGIEAKTNAPMPDIRDESHAIDLFNMGYETLRLKPSKRKRRANQIKLTTVLRLVREAESERTRTLPFKHRKRRKPPSSHPLPEASRAPVAPANVSVEDITSTPFQASESPISRSNVHLSALRSL